MIPIWCVLVLLMILILFIFWREERRIESLNVPVASVQSYWKGQDRRSKDRVSLSLKARYQLVKDAQQSSSDQAALTSDISISGLKLIVSEKLKIGDRMTLQLELSPGELFKCKGEVIWVKDFPLDEKSGAEKEKRHFQVGMRFTHQSAELADRLDQVIHNQSNGITSQAA